MIGYSYMNDHFRNQATRLVQSATSVLVAILEGDNEEVLRALDNTLEYLMRLQGSIPLEQFKSSAKNNKDIT